MGKDWLRALPETRANYDQIEMCFGPSTRSFAKNSKKYLPPLCVT